MMGKRIEQVRKRVIDYLKENEIEVEVNPAVALFGVVTFSLGNVKKIDPDPDNWSEIEESWIEDIIARTAEVSLDEYRKILKDELNSKQTGEIELEIKSILKSYKDQIVKIVQSIKEAPFLKPEEFKHRSENKYLRKYKFGGRDELLERLRDFLSDEDEKVIFITGGGGVGKSRLALEFAEETEAIGEWDVYFVNPDRNFSSIPILKRTLLILDEASRHSDRNKIFNLALNPSSKQEVVKLLLIDRPIFKGAIEGDLAERGLKIGAFDIGSGDIVRFLKDNFEGINDTAAQEIERRCEGSFVYAALYANYFQGRGEVGKLEDILAETCEKYIRDIAFRADEDPEEIKTGIYVLSLITPINWMEDRAYLKEALLFPEDYALLEKVIRISHLYSSDILFSSGRDFVIKPDPIADYLLAEFMKTEKSRGWIDQLLSYMPHRILRNIILAFRAFNKIAIDDLIIYDLFKVLGNIWLELNKSGGKTPEYFSALVLLTGDFKDLPFLVVYGNH